MSGDTYLKYKYHNLSMSANILTISICLFHKGFRGEPIIIERHFILTHKKPYPILLSVYVVNNKEKRIYSYIPIQYFSSAIV